MERAIAAYTKAIGALPRKDHPKASVFYGNRAACHKNLSDYKATMNDCTAALEVDPSNWKAQLRRGYAHEGLASEGQDKYWKPALDDFRAVSGYSADARKHAGRLMTTVRQMETIDAKLEEQGKRLEAMSPQPAEEAEAPAPEPAPAAEPVDDSQKEAAAAAKDKGNAAFKAKKFADAVKHYTEVKVCDFLIHFESF